MQLNRISEASFADTGRGLARSLRPLFILLLGGAAYDCGAGVGTLLQNSEEGNLASGSDSSSRGSDSSSSSSNSSASNGSTSLGTEDAGCSANSAPYAVLPNGSGGSNLEPVSYACVKSFDKDASLAAFETTVYPLVREHCAECHSTSSAAQAPIIADIDVELAHEYALTRVNFRHPEDSKLVIHVEYYLHNCFDGGCDDSRDQLLAAVEAWRDAIEDFIPEVPRGVAEGVTVSESEVKEWIATDRASLASADEPFMVYVSLHVMHNDGLSADRLNVARAALSKVLNSTARWAPEIVNPVDINGKGMVYRFDTRSYWGYNKGVKQLIFGGTDDDIYFGNRKELLSHDFNYASKVSEDPDFAKMVWNRVQEGSKEAAHQGTNATNNKGFEDDYVELSQLVYTLSRPDVYNSIMAIPVFGNQLEAELGMINDKGGDSYKYFVLDGGITFTANTGASSGARQMFRAELESGGYYWKSFDIFTGSGQVFPYWENPLPKFVLVNGGSDPDYSLLASLANGNTYTGSGGVQQHASETFWQMPNGMEGFVIFGGLNQRRTDAFRFIVVDPRRYRAAANNGGDTHGDLRLNQAASCMGCHESGMKRENNNLRDWLEDGTLEASWTNDAEVVAKVRELYPTSAETRQIVENDRKPFLEAVSKIRNGMVLGEDKNVYVEPIINVFEWAQIHYGYTSTLAN